MDDPAGPVAADDGASVVRHEEVLDLSLVPVVTGRVRLRKRVVTETVTHSVEVRREELVIERDAISDGNDASEIAGHDDDSVAFGEFDLEIVLHEERVLITKRVVPVESVRLRTRVVSEDVVVSEEVATEEVDVITEPVV